MNNNQDIFGSIVSFLASCALGLFICGASNWSANVTWWDLSALQVFWLIALSLTGAALSYTRNNEKRQQLLNKTFLVLLGIFLIGSGTAIIQRRELIVKSRIFRGQAAVNWGIMEIVLGALLIVVIITVKKNLSTFGQQAFVICRKCLDPTRRVNNISTCAKCGGELEDLNGFYDRHPELRDKTS